MPASFSPTNGHERPLDQPKVLRLNLQERFRRWRKVRSIRGHVALSGSVRKYSITEGLTHGEEHQMTYVLLIMGFAITGYSSQRDCVAAGKEAAPNPEITKVICVPMPHGGQVVGGGREWSHGPYR